MKIQGHLWDVIVIVTLLLVGVTTLGVIALTRTEGNSVIVQINDVVSAEYPLSRDGEYSLNGGTNTLMIQDGAAYISYSNCPDHICEKTRSIRYVGQTIVCLPNRLSVTVQGEQTEGGVDLIS